MRSGIQRLGVLGGTFDPIHIGHLIAASEARHAFRLDRVLFVPAGKPWQKSEYSDAEDRFMLTTLAVADDPGIRRVPDRARPQRAHLHGRHAPRAARVLR